MSRTVLVTPVFAKAEMLRRFLAYLYPRGRADHEHWILGNRYPVNEQENHFEIARLADGYGCRFIDSGSDLGLHRSLNNATPQMCLESGDYLVGIDCDDRPSPGFVPAFEEVMSAAPRIAVAALSFSVIRDRLRENPGQQTVRVGGHDVWYHPSVEMFNIICSRWSFNEAMGGFSQPNFYYGGIEVAMHREWTKRGMRLAYLMDVSSDAAEVDRSDPAIFDSQYGDWKIAHATQGFTGSFKTYLDQKHPEMLK